MKKRWICMILTAVLLFSCCPAAAAEDAMTFSDAVVAYIKRGESFSATLYSDGTGWYIGYGCAVKPGDYPNGITEAGADALLRSYLQQFADYINGSFLSRYGVSVTQQQFDAMVAMCCALGPGWLDRGNRLPSYLINGIGNYSDQQIASAFAAWCHVGGAVSTAALQRRIAEAKIFLYGDYSFTDYGAAQGWNWVILDANGGENDLSDVAVYKTGEPYGTLPSASRSGWYFAGWDRPDGTLLLPSDTVEQNMKLRAKWSVVPVTPQLTLPAPAADPAPTEGSEPEPDDVPELPETPFSDVAATAWYAEAVTRLAETGIVNGYPDGSFRPGSDVTWGEALKLILRAAGFPEQTPAEAESGKPKPHWAQGYLDFAEASDYLAEGSVSDLNAAITRNEMADLCAAALELTALPPERPFADSERESVLRLYAADILEGSFDADGARVFRGGSRLTRAELCALMLRVQDYVERTWILFAGYRVPIDHDLKRNPYDITAFSTRNGRQVYDDGVTPVHYGIDVSTYQGKIDWAKVAADGIEFAIIRCGFRTYTQGQLGEDDYFEDNIRGALANGLKVGVYFFSQALTVAEVREELAYTLDLIRGWDITLPVVFDWEQVTVFSSRSRIPDWQTVTDCIVAFCDGVAAAGYQPMTYYNPSMAYLRLDLPRLAQYPKWLAHYVEATNYYYDFQMWQYGSSGQVNGIDGRVDMDILFGDLP